VLIERTTRLLRLVRKHPAVVDLLSWSYDGFDPDDIDPAMTVEIFALGNRIDVDTLIGDIQHELAGAHETDMVDTDEDDEDEEEDDLSSTWDVEGYEDLGDLDEEDEDPDDLDKDEDVDDDDDFVDVLYDD
jgi:hypothetical protein